MRACPPPPTRRCSSSSSPPPSAGRPFRAQFFSWPLPRKREKERHTRHTRRLSAAAWAWCQGSRSGHGLICNGPPESPGRPCQNGWRSMEVTVMACLQKGHPSAVGSRAVAESLMLDRCNVGDWSRSSPSNISSHIGICRPREADVTDMCLSVSTVTPDMQG